MTGELLADYPQSRFYDELIGADGAPRAAGGRLHKLLTGLSGAELKERHDVAQRSFRNHGITFTVYQDDRGIEKIFPFDLVPRVFTARTWQNLEAGLRQRVQALNHFLDDVYGERRILRDGAVPAEVVLSSKLFRRELCGFPFPHGLHCHVSGIDLVRDGQGEFRVLEDNLRTPSGVSYMLANRQVLKRVFPELFAGYRVRPIESYSQQLLTNLIWLARERVDHPVVGILTPGIYNAAYFEHVYLAKQMGVELVEGSDLLVDRDRVFMRTTGGLQQIHVLYRRIDDEWLDPLHGRHDSILGTPGLLNAYRAGGIIIANAPGNGVADDKAVYPYVPAMIRYYLGEEPILPNVQTYVCAVEKDRRYVLEHLPDLVIKSVGESGGYGMLIGPTASRSDLERVRGRIQADPRGYIAQPVVDISVQPTFDGRALSPRHQDLRPFVLMGERITVTPGGLTRVALRPGSLVVNSSQGGGSRDTWVLAAEGEEAES
ncbi:MAG TPA: circularly permuted type 2 ATP-grasp protein [Candidatus Dormibacteraeota bacterium]